LEIFFESLLPFFIDVSLNKKSIVSDEYSYNNSAEVKKSELEI
jgi:hypothetical protein